MIFCFASRLSGMFRNKLSQPFFPYKNKILSLKCFQNIFSAHVRDRNLFPTILLTEISSFVCLSASFTFHIFDISQSTGHMSTILRTRAKGFQSCINLRSRSHKGLKIGKIRFNFKNLLRNQNDYSLTGLIFRISRTFTTKICTRRITRS